MRKFAFFLFFVLVCRAERLPVRRYTAADGLAGNRIACILRDSHGFLWFGTTEGLSRFDGYQFTNFTPVQGLPASYVMQIIESRSGAYWIGTSRGPCRFDPAKPSKGSRFTHYETSALGATALLEDRGGAIWCGTLSGLFRLVKGRVAFEPVDIGMPLAAGGDGAIVSALLEDSQGTLWVGAGNALYRRAPDGPVRRYTVRDGLPANFGFIEALLEDRDGQIWIATRKGICRTTPHPPFGRIPIAQVYTAREGLPGSAWTTSLFQGFDGKLWAGAGGLNLFTGKEGSEGPPFRAFSTAHGLAEGSIEALAEDRAGNLWIGTDGNGAMKITRNGFFRFGEQDGLGTAVDSMFESRGGELCVVAEEGNAVSRRMLEWFDGQRFIPVRPAFPPSITNFGWGASQVGFQDHLGEWWFATGQGLCRFPRTANARDLAQLPPKAVYTVRDGMAGDDVFRVFEDSRGDIWIGTHTGLSRWERITESFYRMPDPVDTATAFAEDREGNLWVGTFHGWLGRFREGRWSAMPGFGPGLTGAVSSIHLDHVGRLWVGTNGPGLFRMDDPGRQQPSIIRYTTAEGLSSIRIAAITEDREGRIWISTARGVDLLKVPDEGPPRIRHFSAADGLAEGEGVFAFSDRSGNVWFGRQHGLSRLTPDAKGLQEPPPVLVTGVRVNGAIYSTSDLGETELRLPDLRHGQNHLQFEFGGLQFAAGEALLYQFGMEGDDPPWGPVGASRSVNYAGLRPGHYKFHVRAINSDGAYSPQPAVVSFVILPPFWQRAWFLLLVAVAVTSLTYACYRYRLGQMLELERVRTRIATDLHDDIGASLSQIAVLSELARMDADRGGRIQEPLSRIASISRELVDSMSEIVWAISPRRDRFSELSRRMREFAEDVLVPRNIAFRLEAPQCGEDLRLGPDMRRQVFLIFKECIHNIARHSDCTEATAELEIQREELVLRIGDNGLGGHAAENRSRTYGGQGLDNMRRRAKGLGGSLDLASGAGEGYALVLRAPLASR
jgi:ligand-binding sensor domain-containing protein